MYSRFGARPNDYSFMLPYPHQNNHQRASSRSGNPSVAGLDDGVYKPRQNLRLKTQSANNKLRSDKPFPTADIHPIPTALRRLVIEANLACVSLCIIVASLNSSP